MFIPFNVPDRNVLSTKVENQFFVVSQIDEATTDEQMFNRSTHSTPYILDHTLKVGSDSRSNSNNNNIISIR
jgi:hypothetical protein